jgi:hypothetical protein
MKTETTTQLERKEVETHSDHPAGRKGRVPLTPEEREKKVVAILVRNGVEEKDIKDYVRKKAPETVERVIKVCDKYGFDWKKHQIVFSFPPGNLESNLSACASCNIDPVKFELIADLILPKEEFNALLREIREKNVQPRVLSPEERRRRVLEIIAEEGLKEEEVSESIKKKAPETVKKIIEICKAHNIDWKSHPTIFSCGSNVLQSNLELCELNKVNPEEWSITARLVLPHEQFREYLKRVVTQMGLEFKEPAETV